MMHDVADQIRDAMETAGPRLASLAERRGEPAMTNRTRVLTGEGNNDEPVKSEGDER